jgi:hypothetical protein
VPDPGDEKKASSSLSGDDAAVRSLIHCHAIRPLKKRAVDIGGLALLNAFFWTI